MNSIKVNLRIGLVQLNPLLGRLEENILRSSRIIETAFKTKLQSSNHNTLSTIDKRLKPHILVLPELSLTGYNFPSSKAIEPFLEIMGQGPSYKFGSSISRSLGCYTLIGYPEKYIPNSNNPSQFQIFNSAMLINSSGTVVHNYRKTHLYETDKVWGCIESPQGFETFDIPLESHDGQTTVDCKTTIGICMDLNPWEFKAPFDKFEFANHVLDTKAQLVLVPTAWLNTSWSDTWTDDDVQRYAPKYAHQGTESDVPEINTVVDESKKETHSNRMFLYREDREESSTLDKEAKAAKYDTREMDYRTSQYWIHRFTPLLDVIGTDGEKDRILAICNRSGLEDNLMYAGSSSLIKINTHKSGETYGVTLFSGLSQGTEGVLLREVEFDVEKD